MASPRLTSLLRRSRERAWRVLSCAQSGRVELCVTGERNLPSASTPGRAPRDDGGDPDMLLVQLDGKVAVELLQGTVTMSGLITLHHEPPPSTFADDNGET
jgi:hypothetical protein